jgi:hypothetical protein
MVNGKKKKKENLIKFPLFVTRMLPARHSIHEYKVTSLSIGNRVQQTFLKDSNPVRKVLVIYLFSKFPEVAEVETAFQEMLKNLRNLNTTNSYFVVQTSTMGLDAEMSTK